MYAAANRYPNYSQRPDEGRREWERMGERGCKCNDIDATFMCRPFRGKPDPFGPLLGMCQQPTCRQCTRTCWNMKIPRVLPRRQHDLWSVRWESDHVRRACALPFRGHCLVWNLANSLVVLGVKSHHSSVWMHMREFNDTAEALTWIRTCAEGSHVRRDWVRMIEVCLSNRQNVPFVQASIRAQTSACLLRADCCCPCDEDTTHRLLFSLRFGCPLLRWADLYPEGALVPVKKHSRRVL